MRKGRVERWTLTALLVCFGLSWTLFSQSSVPFEKFGVVTEYDSPSWTPDGKHILFQSGPPREHRIYRIPATGGKPVLLNPDLHRGQVVASPSGRLAFTGRDTKGTFRIWTSNADGSSPKVVTAGMAGVQSSAAWSSDGSKLAFDSHSSLGSSVFVMDAAGGEPKRFAEGMKAVWSRDGKSIGYVVFSLPAMSQWVTVQRFGGQPRRLNCTTMDVVDFGPMSFDWSPDSRQIFVSRLDQGRWQIDVIDVEKDSVVSRLPLPGSAQSPKLSPDGTKIVYVQGDSGHSASIHVAQAEGSRDVALTKAQEFTAGRLVKYKSADGTVIPAFLYKPASSPGPRPAIVWLHGGLAGASIDQVDQAVQYFVGNGFAVLAPNYRSSASFTPELRDLKSGEQIVEDIVASIDYLKALPGVDPSPVFAFGASFGGWSVLRSITARPGLFAAAAEQCGIADVRLLYETSPMFKPVLAARLGGSPEQVPERYRTESPISAVDRLTTPVLILHGDADKTIPFSQATALEAALKKAGKSYEFVPYPGEDHGFQSAAWQDAMERTMRYFTAHITVANKSTPRGRSFDASRQGKSERAPLTNSS